MNLAGLVAHEAQVLRECIAQLKSNGVERMEYLLLALHILNQQASILAQQV